MAFILADRVQETAAANTTVSFTLSGAMTSYQSFTAIGNGNTTYYGATDGTNWEVGLGTYSTTGPTLTRTTILSSSNSGSAVTFSGTVTVWCDYPAGKQISSDYPNALGVVTPAAGTFTTITGQTEVLKGTGTNLLLRSQALTTGPWGLNAAPTTASYTDPLGGSTAIQFTTSANNSGVYQAYTAVSNLTYTFSFYIKYISGDGIITLGNDSNPATATVTYNSSTSTITATGASIISSGVINVGNGWYRVYGTFTTTATSCAVHIYSANTNASSFAAWGAQLEIGSVANAYIPTTTTAIYGTPTLSFSGVAGLGLQSDGSLYVSPAGTGALQAQATTSSTVGGNARGANAVDWQTSRSSAGQVASAATAVIGGGAYNSATSYNATIAGGSGNLTQANYSFIGGGSGNTTNTNFGNSFSAIVGGYLNTGNGYYNFIGAGFTNSGTASAAVTTQAAATNGVTSGSTAVTLAASNASIKVGQYITGTGIAQDTYVSAITTTSLTLSKNATATGTPTLSFYTPHGVVVGGGNNQATGSYSFIGGGGDAGTAANRNVASGDWSAVVGGKANQATGEASFVGGGGQRNGNVLSNQSSGNASFVGAGLTNLASGAGSGIPSGYGNVANSDWSFVGGGQYGSTRGIVGFVAFSASGNPFGTGSTANSPSQSGLLVLARQTTDATPTVLASNSSAASGTNQVILPNNSAYYFKGSVIANVTGAANGAAWSFEGAIMRGANAASTVLIGTPMLNRVAVSSGASAWSIAITADTTNGGLAITVTGIAATTIRWVAKLETTEVTY